MAKTSEIEAYAREVAVRVTNEQTLGIANQLMNGHTDHDYRVSIHCECADIECEDMIRIGRTELDRHHGDLATFVVLPGHVRADAEEVVQECDRYCVVRKRDRRAVAMLAVKLAKDDAIEPEAIDELTTKHGFAAYIESLTRKLSRF